MIKYLKCDKVNIIIILMFYTIEWEKQIQIDIYFWFNLMNILTCNKSV